MKPPKIHPSFVTSGSQILVSNCSCRESEKGTSHSSSSRDGRESVATVVTSASNTSSNETLKCHGSMGDLSSTYGTLPCVPENSPSQVKYDVVHSSKVPPVERHNSECVLYYAANKNAKVTVVFFFFFFFKFSRLPYCNYD